MQEGRWTTITPSQFTHEREALAHIQQLLPDTEPYRAWSNFTFTAQTGHPYEVDLLVAGPGGLYLIEIKSLTGRLISSGSNWILHSPNGTRTFDNPLHLADAKAKRLRSLLDSAARQKGVRLQIPFIRAAVFLSRPGLHVELSEHHRHGVYGPEPGPDRKPGPLPPIWSELISRPPQDERHRVTAELSRALPGLLAAVGIARSRRHYQIGAWELKPRPFDVGPTWQDHHAHHRELPHEHRRVRIYLVERNAAQAERASIERAAKREMLVLHGINHPGIVQVDSLESHEAGPALIFRHDPRAIRLDHYMTQYGDRLDALTRLTMIRQLAEAVAYAHGRRLRHRALSARSVLVTPGRRKGGTEDEAWLNPQLQISDWQAATRAADTTSGSGSARSVLVSSHAAAHLERSAEAYLAPELTAPQPDPVAMDVFGLGALAYLILTGQPPAAARAELLTRLAQENGLRPSSVADSVSEFADELVQAATAPLPTHRLTTVAEFLEMLEIVEEELTAPQPASVHPEPAQPEVDPLEARPGDRIGEWIVRRRLGTGSTCRAFLAEHERTGKLEVLKVGLSDEKGARLAHEARVLGPLADSRVIRLARPEPLQIAGRTVVVLEHAGNLTLARKLRDDGRLTVDELETYSDYLFGALDYLEGEGVYHRDIKPDNIAIRVRPNRTRQLVLFDFSLAGVSVKEINAGTPRYLDPFLGSADRPVYDRHAEWYALAVTLHEMASGELPVWGDGATEPQLTEGPPVLAREAFDPAVRDGLIEFFTTALHRDARRRFASLKDMRDAWQSVFRHSDASPPVGTDHPDHTLDEVDPERAAAARDEAAAKATRATALEAAGLTPRAVSAAHSLEATTVGELLAVANKFAHLRGLGARTRQELQRRVKEWRTRLGERETITVTAAERRAAVAEATPDTATDNGDDELLRVGLDAIATLLVPQKTSRNATEAEATRLLLRLPDPSGELPDLPPWPQQPQVARTLGVTAGRIAQILSKQRRRWWDTPVVRSVRTQVIDLLRDGGRVMGVGELAAALLSSRGSVRTGDELREAIALAAVRAAVEADALADEPRLLLRRHNRTPLPGQAYHPRGDRLLVALEVGDDDEPDTPAAPALLDYADALGAAADRLAAAEVLPSPATVLRTLAAVNAPGGAGDVIDDRRRVLLAAVASERAAATARLEIYPRDLAPVRALRLAQAGVVPPQNGSDQRRGLTPRQIQERVSARFPELAPLPGHPQLGKLLAEAGFELRWEQDRYVPPPRPGSSSISMVLRRPSGSVPASRWTAEAPELAAALRAEEQLASAGSPGQFRALTVRLSRYTPARDELVRRFHARPVNVAACFLAQLRSLVDERPKPTWETVLRADAAEPGSRAAIKLGEYVEAAWQRTAPLLRQELRRDDGPVLLYDAAVLARYRAMERLYELAEAARSGAGNVWLLCPMEDPAELPKLDGTVVRVGDNEWIALPDAWVANAHRSAISAS